MNLQNFPWLSEDLLEVVCVDDPNELNENQEIRFYSDNNYWFVNQGELSCRVELKDQTGQLQALGQRPETLWLLDKKKDKSLFLQVVSFIERLPLDLSIGVDEQISKELADKGEIADSTIAMAISWFETNFLLQDGLNESVNRLVIAHFENTNIDQFLCIGKSWQANIKREGEQLKVQRLTRIKQQQRPGLSMLEGDIIFQDASVVTRLQTPVQKAMLAAALRNNGNYLELWQIYNKKQWTHALKNASELGALRFIDCQAADSEQLKWVFTAESKEQLALFRKQWNSSERQGHLVEVSTEAPDWSQQTEENGTKDKNIFKGMLRFENNGISIYPDEERRTTKPVKQGYIAYSLAGEAAVKRRREEARKSINDGRRLPQLNHLLQGVDTKLNPYKRLKALTPYAKASFHGGKPTTKQERAIDIALNTPDIALVIGPPGTGKTQVIAALQRRLAEDHNTPNIQQQVLVSSYQHDAVDNALTRSDVYGLPAIKVGGRNNKEQNISPLVSWCNQRQEQLKYLLEERRSGEPHVACLERLQQLFLELKMLPSSPSSRLEKFQQISACLDELDDFGVFISSSARSQWDSYCEHSGVEIHVRKESAAVDHELLRKIRGLRASLISYDDDGFDRAYALLFYLQRKRIQLADSDQANLEHLSGSDDKSEADCKQAELLKNRLLDQYLPDYRPPEIRNLLTGEGLNAINQLENALTNELAESRQGIVGVLQRYHDALAFDPKGAERAVENYAAIVGATCQQAASKKMADLHSLNDLDAQSDIAFETVVIDEAARANPLDLFVPMAMAKRRIVLVGDDRQLPHLLEPELEQEIAEQENLSERQRQAYHESLFERLRKQLLEMEKQGGTKRVVMLDTQFRMHPVLGDFISQQFYESEGLEPIKSGRPAADFSHNTSEYEEKVCGWLDVPLREGKESRSGTSRIRTAEASAIAHEAKRLLDNTDKSVSIGVITFYSAQRDEIQLELAKSGVVEQGEIIPEYRFTDVGEERFRVGTVDAFQGKEFDIVLLSIVRANAIPVPDVVGDDAEAQPRWEGILNKKYGHLRLSNRMNVAMSRQRKLLIVVGARDMVNTREAKRAIPAMYHFLRLCGGQYGCIR